MPTCWVQKTLLSNMSFSGPQTLVPWWNHASAVSPQVAFVLFYGNGSPGRKVQKSVVFSAKSIFNFVRFVWSWKWSEQQGTLISALASRQWREMTPLTFPTFSSYFQTRAEFYFIRLFFFSSSRWETVQMRVWRLRQEICQQFGQEETFACAHQWQTVQLQSKLSSSKCSIEVAVTH